MSEYKVDKLEIAKHNEQLALKEYENISESFIGLNFIGLIKKSYELKKARDRKYEPNINITLSVMWTKICMLCGLKENPGAEVWQDITNLIFNYHSDLTLEEIWKAFELERFGEYTEKTQHFQFFNSEYVTTILKKYKAWKAMIKTQHNFTLNTNLQLPEMSDTEKKSIINEGLIRKFNEFKETGKIEPPFVHLFDELLERGLLPKVIPEKPEIFYYYQKRLKQAEEEIKSELNIEKYKGDIDKNKFNEELIKIAEKSSELAQIRAKRIVLAEFFTKQIERNIDFEKLIKG